MRISKKALGLLLVAGAAGYVAKESWPVEEEPVEAAVETDAGAKPEDFHVEPEIEIAPVVEGEVVMPPRRAVVKICEDKINPIDAQRELEKDWGAIEKSLESLSEESRNEIYELLSAGEGDKATNRLVEIFLEELNIQLVVEEINCDVPVRKDSGLFKIPIGTHPNPDGLESGGPVVEIGSERLYITVETSGEIIKSDYLPDGPEPTPSPNVQIPKIEAGLIKAAIEAMKRQATGAHP